MMKLVSNGETAVGIPTWMLGVVGIVLTAAQAVGAPQVQPATAAGERTQTVSLEYREVEYRLTSYSIPVKAQAVSFKREPDFGQHKVVRGNLGFGTDPNFAVPFVWDKTGGKLYLDLNRDLDLTDDAAGVFTCSEKRVSGYHQTFTNVHLMFNTPSGVRRSLVDLNLYDYRSSLRVTAALRSFWQGKIILGGLEFQVGVAEADLFTKSDAGRPGYLLLRPWERYDQHFYLTGGGLDAVQLPTSLFLQGQSYRVKAALDAGATPPGYKLELTEQPAQLGEVEITGQYINRLVLEGGPCTVVLDSPGRPAKVPVGTYTEARVTLKQGKAEAYWDSNRQVRFVVGENKPAVIALGGPLTNSVSAKRRGGSLQLSYELVGGGGQRYGLANEDRSQPPEFVVYKAGKKIASGKFEYG